MRFHYFVVKACEVWIVVAFVVGVLVGRNRK
jgi:hypothetical protein